MKNNETTKNTQHKMTTKRQKNYKNRHKIIYENQ